MDKAVIDAVAAAGFAVYMRHINDSFLLFTDGKNIGYLQDSRGRGLSLTSVHKANRTTGTGFALGELAEINRETLSQAFVHCPSWARHDAGTVRKYRDIEEYRAENSFNAAYAVVAEGRANG
jgi:hypothetical protein